MPDNMDSDAFLKSLKVGDMVAVCTGRELSLRSGIVRTITPKKGLIKVETNGQTLTFGSDGHANDSMLYLDSITGATIRIGKRAENVKVKRILRMVADKASTESRMELPRLTLEEAERLAEILDILLPDE